MSEMRKMLAEAADRLFADLATRKASEDAERGELDRQAWSKVEEGGYSAATRSVARGGDGADRGDALAVAYEAGRHALALPLIEALLAELVLARAGLPPCPEIVTVTPTLPGQSCRVERAGAHATLAGKVSRVPWGRHADTVVLVARDQAAAWTTVVVRGASVAEKGANFANEPRDAFVLDGLRVPAADVGKPGESLDPDGLRFIGAQFRAAQMAGALSRVLALSVQYAKERVQFGKPIGQFQAVQQQLAVLASQSAAANAAFDALTAALDRGSVNLETAAAKARVGEAGHIGAGIAHAVHAAMGFTQEHSLHRFTRRIWSWRDEFGSEIEWAEWLGAEVLARGGNQLWPLVLGECSAS